MHRVDAYEATEVMRADDQEETVFSGQWYKSNGKHSGQSEGNANHVGTSVSRCSFPVPDPCGVYHQACPPVGQIDHKISKEQSKLLVKCFVISFTKIPPISARNVPKLPEMSLFEPRKKSKKRIAISKLALQ